MSNKQCHFFNLCSFSWTLVSNIRERTNGRQNYLIFWCEYFNLLLLLGGNFNNFNNFVTLASTRLRLPENDPDALKHVGVLMIYKTVVIYICCTFVGLDNKLKNYLSVLSLFYWWFVKKRHKQFSNSLWLIYISERLITVLALVLTGRYNKWPVNEKVGAFYNVAFKHYFLLIWPLCPESFSTLL